MINDNEIKLIVLNVVNKHFRREFINRIDEIVVFHPLNSNHIIDIANIQLSRLYNNLTEKTILILILLMKLQYYYLKLDMTQCMVLVY